MGCGQSSRVKAMKDGRDSVDTNETLPVTAPRRTVQQPDRNGVQVVDELDDVLIDNAERLVRVQLRIASARSRGHPVSVRSSLAQLLTNCAHARRLWCESSSNQKAKS